ncbi:hypothetical protein VTN00DRAFT_6609 [Thermoascus crustaceus]|uniref:uncharacterized protein n=1 Tax=Thermoascus crustaceus TaxID=5088 RepID=UPI003743154B
MDRIPSGITWCDEEEFIGSQVIFQNSVWRLDRKVSEKELYDTEQDAQMPGGGSEARAVFFCSRLDSSEEAAIKIRMQYDH